MFFIMRSTPEPRKPSRNITPKGWKPTPSNVAEVKSFLREVNRSKVIRQIAELEETTKFYEADFHPKKRRIRERARKQFQKDFMQIVLKVSLDELKIKNSLERNKIVNAFLSIIESPRVKYTLPAHVGQFALIESYVSGHGFSLHDFLQKVKEVERRFGV
jgi:hypothetical protein